MRTRSLLSTRLTASLSAAGVSEMFRVLSGWNSPAAAVGLQCMSGSGDKLCFMVSGSACCCLLELKQVLVSLFSAERLWSRKSSWERLLCRLTWEWEASFCLWTGLCLWFPLAEVRLEQEQKCWNMEKRFWRLYSPEMFFSRQKQADKTDSRRIYSLILIQVELKCFPG